MKIIMENWKQFIKEERGQVQAPGSNMKLTIRLYPLNSKEKGANFSVSASEPNQLMSKLESEVKKFFQTSTANRKGRIMVFPVYNNINNPRLAVTIAKTLENELENTLSSLELVQEKDIKYSQIRAKAGGLNRNFMKLAGLQYAISSRLDSY